MDRLNQVNLQMSRDGKGYTLYMLDLYDFEMVNDTYGHDAGDETLK